MKPKIKRKLSLNKNTVVHLNSFEMYAVKGRGGGGNTCEGICIDPTNVANCSQYSGSPSCNTGGDPVSVLNPCESLDQIVCTTTPNVTCL